MRFSIWCGGLAAVAVLAGAAPACAAYVYGPGAAYETTEGNLNNIVFNHVDRHHQWVFAPGVFGPDALTINGFSLRFDSIVTNQYVKSGVFALGSSFAIKLATIDGLASPTYAANLANAVTVMSGAQKLPWTIGGPEGATKPWGVHLAFTTPFDYDPSSGSSLVIDLTIPGQDMYGTMDFVADYYSDPTAATPGYRVFNLNTSAATGSLQTYAPVIRFDVSPQATAVVPEPATWALMLLGFGAMGWALRRREAMPARA
jgi:hypothetical protein